MDRLLFRRVQMGVEGEGKEILEWGERRGEWRNERGSGDLKWGCEIFI